MTGIAPCDVGPRDGLQNEGEGAGRPLRGPSCAARWPTPALRRVRGGELRPRRPRAADGGCGGRPARARRAGGGDRHLGARVGPALGLDPALAAGGPQRARRRDGDERSSSRANVNRSRDEAAEAAYGSDRARRRGGGDSLPARWSVAFGCPFEGEVDPGVVDDLLGRMATPARRSDAGRHDRRRGAGPGPRGCGAPPRTGAVGVHLHDTRNRASGRARRARGGRHVSSPPSAARAAAVRRAPRATSPPRTSPGCSNARGTTGVDVDAVVAVAHWLEEQLGRPLPGALSRPGCKLTGV